VPGVANGAQAFVAVAEGGSAVTWHAHQSFTFTGGQRAELLVGLQNHVACMVVGEREAFLIGMEASHQIAVTLVTSVCWMWEGCGESEESA
jgi:hypothetical protein